MEILTDWIDYVEEIDGQIGWLEGLSAEIEMERTFHKGSIAILKKTA